MSDKKGLASVLDNVPEPAATCVPVYLERGVLKRRERWFPWLFEKYVLKAKKLGKPGDFAVIYNNKDKFVAIGLYDTESPIKVRVLQVREKTEIDRNWFFRKMKRAVDLRSELPLRNTDGYRLINGENDGLPGLIIDRYSDTLVIKIYTSAWILHLKDLISALREIIPVDRIVLRMSRLVQEQEEFLYGLEDGQVIYGKEHDGAVIFKENGLKFEADVKHGQKTGFFLDQRDNRNILAALVNRKRVLNVFSYTGGFTVYAASGGAFSVTSIDISEFALEGLSRNIKLNSKEDNVRFCQQKTIKDDAFKALKRLKKENETFEVVIIDPPSFARKKAEVEGAMEAYKRLVKLGLRVLEPGGLFVMASCSSRVEAEEFFALVKGAAKSIGRPLKEVKRTQHPIDHPIDFYQGAYLKCLFAYA